MRKDARRVIGNILLIYPMLSGLQNEIEKEQERIIGDLISPARKIMDALIALDNRRVDLCNLAVLYRFIERELGVEFSALCAAAESECDGVLFLRAQKAISRAGYDIPRVKSEFAYLFKALPRKRIKPRVMPECVPAPEQTQIKHA